jgi:CRP/FNR family transcriptional regulator, cyclic AMP receptor protein
MATSPLAVAPQKPLEDPLAHLPCSSIAEYRKGQMIYNQDQPSTSIYLVIDGKVKVSRLADDGHQVVVDIYQPDEFFGESAFLSLPHRSEQATALENTKVMTWSTAEIEDIVMKRPRLAVALLQILVQRTIDFTHRIESFSVDNIARRLARSLIRFSERLGIGEEDGSVRMVPFTHELLSQYVGTSREIVTHYMNQFRRQGYLRYSRKGIILYRDAFKEWLRQNHDWGQAKTACPITTGPSKPHPAWPGSCPATWGRRRSPTASTAVCPSYRRTSSGGWQSGAAPDPPPRVPAAPGR